MIALGVLGELDSGHAASATGLLARLPAIEDTRSPKVLLARLLVCERDLDVGCQRTAAVTLLTVAPQSAAAPLAAETLRRLTGESTQVDALLRADLEKLLHFAPTDAPDLETQHLLRDALAGLRVAQGDFTGAQQLRDEGGVAQSWEIVGPLSAYHYLQFDTRLGPEVTPKSSAYNTPWGDEAWRPLKMNNGQLPIGHALERSDVTLADGQSRSPTGDIFYLRTEVKAQGGGVYLRFDSTASARVFLDGKEVLNDDLFRRLLPRSRWLAIDAADGAHSLIIKIACGDPTRTLRVEVLPQSVAGTLPLTSDALARALGKVAGPYLGRSLAARVLAPLDPHGAIELLSATRSNQSALGTFGLSVRAELWPILGTLDDEDARGRTQADLDAWVERDPHNPQARIRRSQLLQDLSRFALAQRDLEVAAAAAPIADVLVAQARLLLAREAGPLAAPILQQALVKDPGNCGALDLQLAEDDAQNAIAQGDQVARAYATCPGGQQALALRRSRAEGPAPLADYWRGRLNRSPGDPEAALQLSDLLFAQGDAAGAIAALDVRLRSWPEDGGALRHRAIIEDLVSRTLTPSATWNRVLEQDAADLTLRRALALLAGKPQPLEDLLPGVAATIAQPPWLGPGRPPTATLLDSGAVWLHADGTITERVRTLEIPLDETALGPLGELELPGGAALVALRTHKRDGRVLDADAQVGGEKHTVSAPSLEVGDLLEIDYLVSTPPPRRAGGSVADAFYFAASDSSLRRSIYTLQSDRPAQLDAHRIDAPATFTGRTSIERTRVAAIPEEPSAPPQNEYFPWVQVGTGSTDSDLARSVSDQLLDKVAIDEGIEALLVPLRSGPSGGATGGPDDRSRAQALWRLLSAALRPEGGSLSSPASEVVGQGSGNLLLPTKAGLDALGIPSQFVLVSGPAQSKEPHHFARLGEYADVLLRIEPRGSEPFFLAAGQRDAPFAVIPPNLCGSKALILPTGDAPGEVTQLPQCPEKADRLRGPNDHLTQIELTLAPDGSADGSAHETLFGFEAVNLRGALAEVDDGQRRQGVESALAAVFQGVELTDVRFDLGTGPGAPLSVFYKFKVPEFASHEGGDLWSSPLRGFPAQLAQRYAQLASRQLPLLVASGERPSLELTLHLPAGGKFVSTAKDPESTSPKDVWLDTPFGSYIRKESRSGTSLTLHEKLVLPPQRVAPDKYPDFAGFADSVDRAQTERVRYTLSEGRTQRPIQSPLDTRDRWSGL